MPGRFVYWMNVSADLRIEHDAGEDGGGEWMRITEALHREFNTRARALSAMVQGRRIYETMEAFWPAARHDTSLPDYMREYGEIWTSKPKILLSGTRTSADFNTSIVGTIDELARLRAESTGDIGIGGANVATQLLAAGLLDELLLFTHPVLLDRGRPLFDTHDAPIELNLIEHQVFEAGVTMHRYEVTR